MPDETYTISDVADLTGVSIHTLRYYEDIDLLDPIQRAPNGHRRYSAADVQRMQFLTRLRATGMSIREMQAYVDLYRAGDATLRERRERLQAHRAHIAQQIAALQETMAFIDAKIARYTAQSNAQETSHSSATTQQEHTSS